MISEKLNVPMLLNNKVFYERNNVEGFIKFQIKKPRFLMIIAGCSGSGKSVFEKKLVEEHGEYFNKLPQITTREKRNENDNGYYFIDKEVYSHVKKSLIARLDDFNNNKYGTLPLFQNNKINTVIASADAVEDLFSFINKEKDLYIVPLFVLFDIKDENISKEGQRSDRDSSFFRKRKNQTIKCVQQIFRTMYLPC